jgi:spore germination protein YaaH
MADDDRWGIGMRNNIRRTICSTAVSVCLLAGAGVEAASAAKLNMGYLYFGSQEAYVRQVDATNRSLDRVSPTLFDLTPEGELKLASDIRILAEAMKSRGVKVVPFLSNHWDRETGRKALANREALSTRIAEEVVRYQLDGVNVDIENVTEADRDAYTDLVRLLRQKLPGGAEVSVAVGANPHGWTKGWQASYDMAGLAKYSDYLMLMSYDEHWSGSPSPGPVASLGWVEKSVQQILKEVPPEKVVLGIPFYGRFWKEGGGISGAGIPNRTAESLARRYGIEPRYDEAEQSAVFTFIVGTAEEPPVVNGKKLEPGSYTVWFENERSIKRKLDLVHQYKLRGTGSWCLSQESPETWVYYSSWLNGQYYSDAAGHWAENEIRTVAQKGWMTGKGSLVFAPQAPLTRAEAAAILVRSLGLAEAAASAGGAGAVSGGAAASGTGAGAGFSDVPAGHWGRAEIGLARRFGLVDGYADGTFAPDRPVSREQLSAMLYRAIGPESAAATAAAKEAGAVTVLSPLQPFKDMQASRWSWTAVTAMQGSGLLQGYPDGSFRPTASVTRAEAAALLLRSGPRLEAR